MSRRALLDPFQRGFKEGKIPIIWCSVTAPGLTGPWHWYTPVPQTPRQATACLARIPRQSAGMVPGAERRRFPTCSRRLAQNRGDPSDSRLGFREFPPHFCLPGLSAEVRERFGTTWISPSALRATSNSDLFSPDISTRRISGSGALSLCRALTLADEESDKQTAQEI